MLQLFAILNKAIAVSAFFIFIILLPVYPSPVHATMNTTHKAMACHIVIYTQLLACTNCELQPKNKSAS